MRFVILGVNWGSSTQAQIYKTALTSTQKLISINEHVKNYKPDILLLCDNPQYRCALVDFAYLITKNNSLLIVGEIEKVGSFLIYVHTYEFSHISNI